MHQFRSLLIAAATLASLTPTVSGQPVTTIITHGYAQDVGTPVKAPWMEVMADAIVARAGGGTVLRYQPVGGDWTFASGSGPSIPLSKPIVLLFNWVDESDGGIPPFGLPATNWGYAQAAGDALYAALRDPSGDLSGVELLSGRLIHFIGHSRGTVVNSYAIARLAGDGIDVDQMTTLDPHPVDGTLDGCLLGFPNWGDESPRKWSNVTWADNYWRADGGGLHICDFDGIQMPLGQVFNWPLFALLGDSAPDDEDDLAILCSLEHVETHAWYTGTIPIKPGPQYGRDECLIDYDAWYGISSSEGYDFSFIGGATRPNQTEGEAPPLLPILYNGGFDNGAGVATLAGWLFHPTGVGSPPTLVAGADPYLRLNASSPQATHNRFLVPPCGVNTLSLQVKREGTAGANDRIRIQISDAEGGDVVEVIGPTAVSSLSTSFAPLTGEIPSTFGDRASLLKILLEDSQGGSVSTVVDVDDLFVSTNSWSQQDYLTASDASAHDIFGASVALSGETAVIGAPHDSSVGSAYVFIRSGTMWSQQAKLTAADVGLADNFGGSVALSSETAVIGAHGDDLPGAANAGSAYVFVRSGDIWVQQAKLTAADAAAGDHFGSSVALSGDTAVIGAYLDDDGGTAAGSAYVFVRNGTTWTQQTKLIAADAAAEDEFGSSVEVFGDTAIIGAPWDDLSSTYWNVGAAYIFVRTGTKWGQQMKLAAADVPQATFFGASVAISGDTAVVGAPGDGLPGAPDAGAVYTFVRSGGTWVQQAKLTAADAATNDAFGSVALSGDTALIGAAGDDLPGRVDAGSAYIFIRFGDTWVQQAKLTAGDAAPAEYFGGSVALSGETALIGAYWDDLPGADNAGSAYTFASSCPSVIKSTPADLNGDREVNGFDLALLLGAWGPCPTDPRSTCPADLDGSGIVNGIDLAILLGSWTS